MDQAALEPDGEYLIKHLTTTTTAKVAAIHYQVDVNSLEHAPVEQLQLNAIGRVELRTTRPLVFDTYERNRQAGAFILTDRISNSTVAAGMISRSVRSESDHTRRLLAAAPGDEPITGALRAARFNQQPATVWLRGRTGAGKLELALALEQRLFTAGYLPYLLDLACLSVDIRQVFGFTGDERLEDLRRAVAMARMCREIGR